jgi:hypothetical protein
MRPEDQKSDWSADAHRIYWILSYDIVGDGILTEDELRGMTEDYLKLPDLKEGDSSFDKATRLMKKFLSDV